MPQVRLRGLAALLALLVCAAVAPGSAYAGFGPPAELSAPSSAHARIALTGPDEVLAAWSATYDENYRWDLQVGTHPFGSPQALDAKVYNNFDLASDQEGHAILTWTDGQQAWAADNGPGTEFGSPVALSGGSWWADFSKVAMNSDGDAVVLSDASDPDIYGLRARFRPFGGTFGPPRPVLPGAYVDPSSAQVALSDNGEAIVLWKQWDSSSSSEVLRVAVGTAADGFGPPKTLVGPGYGIYQTELAVDSTGGAVAAWIRPTGSREVLEVASRPPGGVFGYAQQPDAPGNAWAFDLAGGGNGSFALAYSRYDNGGANVVKALTGNLASGALEEPIAVEAGWNPKVAVSPAGGAFIAWQGSFAVRVVEVGGDGAPYAGQDVVCSGDLRQLVSGNNRGAAVLVGDYARDRQYVYRTETPGSDPGCAQPYQGFPFGPGYVPYYGYPIFFGPQSQPELIGSVLVPKRQRLDKYCQFRLGVSGISGTRVTVKGFVKLRGLRSRLYVDPWRAKLGWEGPTAAIIELRGPEACELGLRHRRNGGKARLVVTATHKSLGAEAERRVVVPLAGRLRR